MRWYAFSGSWRITNDCVKHDVEREVKKIIKRGDGIVTGGSLGVDYFAAQTVLEYGDVQKQLKLCLPIKLKDFCSHYSKRADEGVISRSQAQMIIKQLSGIEKIARNSVFDEWGFTKADKESYFARNTEIIKMSDALFAFQVNHSEGTQDAINKARKLGKEIVLRQYNI